ncbi:MAG: hypothetical protein AAFV88_08770, partial [Planctomycetota bacterium]
VDYLYTRQLLEKGEAYETTRDSLRSAVDSGWEKLQADDLTEATRQIIAAQLSQNLIGFGAYEPVPILDDLITEFEQLASNASSLGILNRLEHLYLMRVHQELVASNEDYARFVKSSQGTLAPSYLLALAVSDVESLRTAIVEHPDFVTAIKMLTESLDKFDEAAGTWAWAILHPVDPERVASTEESDERRRIREASIAIEERTSRAPFTIAVEQYWRMKRAGESTNADAAFQQLKKLGFEMPLRDYLD